MVKLTMIVRLRDGLPLCEGLELDKVANMETYKQQAKVSEVLLRLLVGDVLSSPLLAFPSLAHFFLHVLLLPWLGRRGSALDVYLCL